MVIPVSVRAAPADAYWVGNGGNWSDDDNHWATTSAYNVGTATFTNGSTTVEGAGGCDWTTYDTYFIMSPTGTWYTIDSITDADTLELTAAYSTATLAGSAYTIANPANGNLPDAGTNVHFDANSFISGSQQVVINGSDYCENMDWTGVTNSPILYWAADLYIYSSLTLVSGMSLGGGGAGTNLYFKSTAASKTISTLGKTIPTYTVTFDGLGGEWTLQSNFAVGTAGGGLTLTNGSLVTDGYTVTSGLVNIQSGGTKALTLGSSTVNCSSTWSLSTTGTTFDAGTSTIKITGNTFTGGGETYYDVELNSAGVQVNDANAFRNLTRTGTNAVGNVFYIGANQVVTGIFTATGFDAATKTLDLYSTAAGVQRTITAAAIAITNCDIKDIKGAGASTWVVGPGQGNTNVSGNDNLTFTLPVVTTQAVSAIGTITATGNGTITDTGGPGVSDTKRGVCWNITGSPTVADSKEEEVGSFSAGAFPESMTGLSSGIHYYVKAYAYNEAGYGYGAEVDFWTLPAAPTGVSATSGVHTDKVVITWTKSTGAIDYHVWRDALDLGSAGDVATFDDVATAPTITPGSSVATDGTYSIYVALSLSGTSANNGTTYTYKVVASNVTGNSADSNTDTGYRGVGALAYQWQRSAGDSDAAYSNLVGATLATYNDTSGVVTPDGRYYKCVLDATGAIQQTSAANRGYKGTPVSPVVVTSSATSVTSTSATLNGSLTSLGTYPTVDVYFQFGIPGSEGFTTHVAKVAPAAYTQGVTISKGRAYNFRAVGSVGTVVFYGSWIQFRATGSACFIATSVYGEDSAEVKVLRRFRDTVLLDNYFGRKFIDLYYTCGPDIADYLDSHESLKPVVRYVLNPVIQVIKKVN